jgi:hypothetical protein
MQAQAELQQIPAARKPGPEKKLRAGALSATIWRNEGTKDGQPSPYFTVSIERSFKDKAGAWKHTPTLRQDDLPKVTLLLQEAYRWLLLEARGSPAEAEA